MRTRSLTIAALAVAASMAAVPAMAAKHTNDQTKATPIKHSMMMRHHASLQTRERGAVMPRGSAEARSSFANANASANTPVKDEPMAAQLGKTATVSGRASDPTCRPGTMTPLDDGKLHPCQ